MSPKQKIKLLIAIIDLTAGTGMFARNLAGGIRKYLGDQFEVSLLLFRDRDLLPTDKDLVDHLHIMHNWVYQDWRRFFQLPLHILRFRRRLKELSPDVIFTVGTYSNVITSMVAGKTPVLLSEHMNMSRRVRASWSGKIQSWFMRWTYPQRLVVCAAEGITRDLEQNFGATRSLVIFNGIDVARLHELANAPVNLPTSKPYFVGVGRLVEQKDFTTMIRGFAAARQRGLSHDLVIVGDGPERQLLTQLARDLEVGDCIHFVGQQSNPYPFMRASQGLVLTSHFEGFSYALVEAMVQGLPCIATRSDGPEALLGAGGEFGILVPPQDPPALTEALLKMVDPHTHEHFIAQSRLRAQELSIERMAESYGKVLLEELRRSGIDPETFSL